MSYVSFGADVPVCPNDTHILGCLLRKPEQCIDRPFDPDVGQCVPACPAGKTWNIDTNLCDPEPVPLPAIASVQQPQKSSAIPFVLGLAVAGFLAVALSKRN